MPRIHCSQCGQEGHNRRNRRCPSFVPVVVHVVVPATHPIARPEIINARQNLCRSLLAEAVRELATFIQYIEVARRHTETGTTSGLFIIQLFTKLTSFCAKMNRALEYDTNRNLINAQAVFEELSEQVEHLNTFIVETTLMSSYRMTILFADRRFNARLVDETGNAAVNNSTKAYLKQLPLVQDLNEDPACDCPICFDAIGATESIVTNCQHSFCVTCIKEFTSSIKNATKKPKCPMCRTTITQFKTGKSQVYTEISEHLKNL